MSRVKGILLLLVVFSLLLSACGGTEAPEAATEAPVEEPQVTQTGYVIGLAVHESPAESSFWGVVETGAKDGAAAMGVELKSGGSLDPAELRRLSEGLHPVPAPGRIFTLLRAMDQESRMLLSSNVLSLRPNLDGQATLQS